METNWNQLIERYLNNELSAEGKSAFEVELEKNPDLQNEFELHQLTKELIQRGSLRTWVKESGKWFHLKKVLVNSGIAVIIAGVLAATVYFLAIRTTNSSDKTGEPQVLEQSLVEQMEQSLALDNIDPEYFQFTGKSDVFLSESGVLLSLTDESFLLNGKSYKGEAIVQWQEAQSAADIVKAGLSTKSGDQLLETQGMFSLNAFTPEGKKLQLTDKGVYVQVPVGELKKDMKLFTGVPGKNGTIDWQAPVELERLPKPKDMSKMDLFPPRYEPKLNELKWYKEKRKRDSLYLSFEEAIPASDTTATIIDGLQMYTKPQMESPKRISGTPYMDGATQISMIIPPMPQEIVQGKFVPSRKMVVERPEDKVHWSFDVRYVGNNEAEITATVTIEPEWHINALNIPKGSFGIATSLILTENPNFKLIGKPSEPKPLLIHDKVANEDLAYHMKDVQFKQRIKLLSKKAWTLNGSYRYQTGNNSHALAPFFGTFSLEVNGLGSSKSHIPPSKVLAIWKKQFNNTNLATQDFEDRMKEIHNTCDEKVFDVYAKNLNEPLWKLDEQVVKMGYPQFKRFAEQKIGKVQIDDVHQQNLAAFYEKAVETLHATGRKNVEAALMKDRQWDQQVMQERDREVLCQGIRANLNTAMEADFNLVHLSKQLGQTLGFAITGETVASRDKYVSDNRAGTPAKQSLPIVVNIDRLTKDLLSSRKSADVFTLDKGKKATIRYNDFRAAIESFKDYKQLYFYLLPKELNSYERLDFVNGKLNYPLNNAISYSGLAFGMNEDGFYLFEVPAVNAADLGKIKLQKVSEKEFETRLKELNANRGVYLEQITGEIGWLFKEKANYQVQRKRRENEQFRNTIRPTIYSCLSEEIPVQEIKKSTGYEVASQKEDLFSVTDNPPSFPGGMTALRKYLDQNILFPKSMEGKEINGKVTIRFIVDENGKVTNATVKKGIPDCPECDREALRVVQNIPSFIPATANGKNVSTSYAFPITFKTK